MAKADIPFTDSSISTDNPSGTVMTVLTLIAGFAVFSMASDIGDYVGGEINSKIGDVIGFNPASGEEEGADIV